MDVLVRGEFGAFGVGRPGVRRGRGRRCPGRVGSDDLEAVTGRQTAVRLRRVADHHLNGRGRASRAAGERLEIPARVLHTLMHQRNVLGVHASIDPERDARRIRWRRRRRRAIGIEYEHLPEDAHVLEPRRALDERPDVQAVRAGKRRRLQVELEPRDLAWPDVRRGLLSDAIETRPSARWRTELAVATEDARLILAWLAVPRTEVGRLAHPSRDPSERPRVVIGEGRSRCASGTEPHVAALSVPGRVKARQLGRGGTGRSDARTDIGHARRCSGLRPSGHEHCGGQHE